MPELVTHEEEGGCGTSRREREGGTKSLFDACASLTLAANKHVRANQRLHVTSTCYLLTRSTAWSASIGE
jgi:hypothetical protein